MRSLLALHTLRTLGSYGHDVVEAERRRHELENKFPHFC